MPSNELLLCIDIGGDSIKAAEFSYSPTGDMVLERFAFSEFGKELNGEEDNFPVFATALSDIVTKNGFQAKKIFPLRPFPNQIQPRVLLKFPTKFQLQRIKQTILPPNLIRKRLRGDFFHSDAYWTSQRRYNRAKANLHL